MLQDVVKTVVMSAVSRVMESMGTLYIAIAATLIVVICGFFLYRRFTTKSVAVEEPNQAPSTVESPPQKESIHDREEAFAAAMHAEQAAAELELQKRMATQHDPQVESTEQQTIEHVQ